jgi:hypothetical protein
VALATHETVLVIVASQSTHLGVGGFNIAITFSTLHDVIE